MIKLIRIIAFGGLAYIFLVTFIGLIISFIEKWAIGFGRYFGVPEIVVIGIIMIPALALVVLARWLENRNKK